MIAASAPCALREPNSMTGLPCCRAHNAARLGRDHALVVDAQKHHRLDELCLHHRSSDGHDRLMREDRRSLRHRPDITLELKITQIRKKIFTENIFAAQICDVRIRKSEVLADSR